MKAESMPKLINNFSKSITCLIFSFMMLFWIATDVTANQGNIFTLGEITDQRVSEGELLNFSIRVPDHFSHNVKWQVTGFPEAGIFYDIPAFPGAEGFGAGTVGGRGGKVVKVTNLNRSGEGSLAAALAMKEPRIIVFDVSGVINGSLPEGEWLVNKSGRIYTKNAPVTIAGQTAPGGGITINGELVFADGDGGTYTDNVIGRFFRTRSPYYRTNIGDAIMLGGHSAVLDHVSGAWGDDETFDLSNLKNASVQWCGIEESSGSGTEWEVFVDADADGMADSWERKVKNFSASDPVKDYILDILPNADLDNDGKSNLQEYNDGTNPLSTSNLNNYEWKHLYDGDGDGLADWWEQKIIAYNTSDAITSLADVIPNADNDGDLSTNLEEYKAGTNPLAKPAHNYGMIAGYDGRNISLHHNFFAHHSDRNPLSGVEILDNRNNVIYNADLGMTSHPLTMNNQRPGEMFKTNIVGNYFKAGHNSPKLLSSSTYFYPFIGINGTTATYENGNYFDMFDNPSGYFGLFDVIRRGITSIAFSQKIDNEFLVPEVKTYSAIDSYSLVLAHAGAMPYDAITARNIDEIKTRTGKWGKHFPESGLMEGLIPSETSIDSDNDGMPDEWETQSFILDGKPINRGNIINQYSSDNNQIVKYGESALVFNGKVISGTENRYIGYTYIEYYINELADRMILRQLYENGYDETYLPGYGKENLPTVSWVPTYNQAGSYNVTFTATDDIGNSLSKTIQIVVENINRKPYVYPAMYLPSGTSLSTHLVTNIEVGKGIEFEFYVNDIDGDDYTVTIENMPTGAKITDTGKLTDKLKGDTLYRVYKFEWGPTTNDIGMSGSFAVIVTDFSGNKFSKELLYKVIAPTKPLYNIVSSINGHGSIYPSSNILVQEGSSKLVKFIPSVNYEVNNVIIDGVSKGSIPMYIFDNIKSSHVIEVVFSFSEFPINGKILELNFNGNVADTSGLDNNGIVNGAVLTNDRFGNPNKAYYFDGIDDYIQVKDNDYFNLMEYTLSAWVYGTKSFEVSQYFFSKNSKDGYDSIGMYAAWGSLYAVGSDYPRVNLALRGKENQWNHIAVVKNLELNRFYINGELVGTATNGYCENNDINITIGVRSGASGPTGGYFKGTIDDIKLFNTALTTNQINKLIEVEEPAEQSTPVQQNIYTISIADPEYGTISHNGDLPLMEGASLRVTFTPDDGYQISDVLVDGVSIGAVDNYTFSKVNSNHSLSVEFNLTKIDGLLLKLNFDGNLLDSSGHGNDGFSSGNAHPQVTNDRFGNANRAFFFDGVDDYIEIINSNYFNLPEYTLSVWVYGMKDFDNAQCIVSKSSSDSENTIGLFSLRNNLYSNGTGYPNATGVLADKENKWLHIVLVKKANVMEFFINGISQKTFATGTTKNNTLSLVIGARARTGTTPPNFRFFKGALDDIQIYNRALSASEILVLTKISSIQ